MHNIYALFARLYTIFAEYSFHICRILLQCLRNICKIFSQYLYSISVMLVQFFYDIITIYKQYLHNILYNIHTTFCAIFAQWLYNICTISVFKFHNICKIFSFATFCTNLCLFIHGPGAEILASSPLDDATFSTSQASKHEMAIFRLLGHG